MTTNADESSLTSQQKRVLDLLNDGRTPAQVGTTLGISTNGVYGHMRRIEQKGIAVPRSTSGNGRRRRTKSRRSKRSTKATRRSNGRRPIIELDEGIGKLIEVAATRQEQISDELDHVADQQKALSLKAEALTAENEAIAKRREALAAAETA